MHQAIGELLNFVILQSKGLVMAELAFFSFGQAACHGLDLLEKIRGFSLHGVFFRCHAGNFFILAVDDPLQLANCAGGVLMLLLKTPQGFVFLPEFVLEPARTFTE